MDYKETKEIKVTPELPVHKEPLDLWVQLAHKVYKVLQDKMVQTVLPESLVQLDRWDPVVSQVQMDLMVLKDRKDYQAPSVQQV
jgi:hypothetical protein